MRTIFKILALPIGLIASAAAAAATPEQVVGHHVAMMKKGDLAAIMRDYAPDTVVLAPPGLVRGQSDKEPGVFVGASARKVFATLTDKDHHPGVRTMETRIVAGGPGIARLRWTQFKGTPRQVTGEDIFVVRGGRISYQAILVDPAR